MQPCLEWDSNPQSHCSSGRRHFMPYTKRPLWSTAYWIEMERTCTDVYEGIDIFFIWLKMLDVYFPQRSLHCTVMILAINFVLKAAPAWCSTSIGYIRQNRTSWIASLHRSSVCWKDSGLKSLCQKKNCYHEWDCLWFSSVRHEKCRKLGYDRFSSILSKSSNEIWAIRNVIK
jgi:hypothetical protein